MTTATMHSCRVSEARSDRNVSWRVPSLLTVLALFLILAAPSCTPTLATAAARDPDRFVPDRFDASLGGDEAQDDQNAGRLDVEAFFGDPQLVALVDEAIANNQEINILEQEIVVANSEIMARQGEYLPFVGFAGGVGIEKVGRFTSQGASDAAHQIKRGKEVPEHLPNYGLGFAASWEVDIWQKLRNATKAALYRYLSSIEGRNFAVTQVVAEIARTYYELMALDNQLEVLGRNIQILTDALRLIRIQQAAGRLTKLAVQRFEAEVLKNRSRRFGIRQQVIQAENRLNYLLGRFPQSITRSSTSFLERAPLAMNVGTPMDLFENRPDVRKAELELKAAELDVEVAKASFYPSLSLEAGVGVESFQVHSLVEMPESLFYNAVANVTGPLLNRQALKATYYSANSKQMQAVLGFERAVRQAYIEAATQLARIDNLARKYELKSQQVQILEEAIEVSNRLFGSAEADYVEVLLTRRDALEAQMELIETKKEQFDATVAMYQALGGGWRVRKPEEGDGAKGP